jgi:23S rRNA pseudouridine1911/1915/1917 synthase
MIKIIYEDNHQLVVDKPAGLLTQPSGTEQDSLETQAKEWIKAHCNKPGAVFLHTIHRLDRPVGGIVLFARTSKALTRLQASSRNKQTHKRYMALVEGSFDTSKGTLEHYLIHEEHHARVAHPSELEAKKAILHYNVERTKDGLSLLELELETGRYHQIRAQLSAVRHPIVGDVRYGSRKLYKDGQIALHHTCLQIPHPITGEMQTFESIPPFQLL